MRLVFKMFVVGVLRESPKVWKSKETKQNKTKKTLEGLKIQGIIETIQNTAGIPRRFQDI